MSKIQNGWMTTFFYEQDLKSEYMNGLLLSDLAPGVYNSSSSIYVVDDKKKIDSGIYLYLNKGTTLIFSNGYTDDGTITQRDMSATGTYLIKCVLLEDQKIRLIDTDTINNPLRRLLGYKKGAEDYAPAENFFVTALFQYNSNVDMDLKIPSFKCCVRKTPTAAYGNRLYTTYSDGDSSLEIQDKYTSYAQSYDSTISYLHLGVVKAIDYNSTKRYAYNETKCWDTGKAWLDDYTFIGRGLEEYRRTLTDNQKIKTPDCILDGKSKVYLDFNEGLIDGTLYNKANDIVKIYSGESSPIADYELNTDSIPTGMPTARKDKDRAFNATMLFLALNNRTSKSFDSENPEAHKKEINSIFTNGYIDIDSKILSYQWNGLSDYTYLIDKKEYKFTEFIHAPESSLDVAYILDMSNNNKPITNKILPLDVGLINEKRLKSVITNKNMIKEVIDNMRIEDKISSQECISLVPIALIIREFEYRESTTQWINPFKDNTKCYYDPVNILSYLDLQFKISKSNSIHSTYRDVYTILPVIS